MEERGRILEKLTPPMAGQEVKSSKLKVVQNRDLEVVACPLCGSTSCRLLFKAKNVHSGVVLSEEEFCWARCYHCGLFYLNPRPKENEIGQYYPTDYYHLGIKIPMSIVRLYRRTYYLARIRFVNKFVRSGSKLLDLGSGEGGFVKVAREFGFDAYGVEPNVSGKKLKDLKFKDESFDALTLWHVLEHLHQPKTELREIRRILKKKGRLFLSLPNFESLGFYLGKEDWYHLDTPRHLTGFTKKTILKLLHDSGFKVIKVNFVINESPFDLFETFSFKVFKNNNYLKTLFFLPIVVITLSLKAASRLFNLTETMCIIAYKQ